MTDRNSSDSQFGASYYSVTNLCCVTSSCEVHSADCIILLWSRLSLEECLLFQTVNLPVRMGLTAAGRGGGGGQHNSVFPPPLCDLPQTLSCLCCRSVC